MSSTNQAFVKAFARRNRSQRHAESGSDPQAASIPPKTDEPGSLHVDQSVAESAALWLDPVDSRIARADAPEANLPRPHVDEPHVDEPHVDEPHVGEPQVDEPQVGERAADVAPTRAVKAETNSAIETPSKSSDSVVPAVSVQSLQHIHTAYAAAVSDLELGYIETASAVPVPVDSSSTDAIESVTSEVPTIDAADGCETETAFEAESSSAHEVTQLRIDKSQSQPPKAHDQPPKAHDQREALVPFQPVWEVDVFDIPTLVADLFFDGALFQQIAERMGEAVSHGLNSLLVTSTQQGEGRSSTAIGIAMAAAAAGIRVALVDADTEHPTLADDLRLDLQYGWVDTIRGGLPIKEVAVHAVEDGVTLIPLMPPHGPNAATAAEVVQLLEILRSKFELVIIDGPTAESSSLQQCAAAVDTAVIVRDMTRTDATTINDLSYRLRESGVQGVGVVENFA